MIQSVMLGVLGVIVECLIGLFWWFILFPVVWLVSLPFILVLAPFRRERYGRTVADMLATTHALWRDWGMAIIP